MAENLETTLALTENQILGILQLGYASGRICEAAKSVQVNPDYKTEGIDKLYKQTKDKTVSVLKPLAERSEQVRRKLEIFEEMYKAFAIISSYDLEKSSA